MNRTICLSLAIFFGFVLAQSQAAPIPTPSRVAQEIQNWGEKDYNKLYDQWQKVENISPVLEKLSLDRSRPETTRYIAMMGLAKIGGADVLKVCQKNAADKSWMLRSGTLQLLPALKKTNPNKTTEIVEKLAFDRALVVRHEALRTLKVLELPIAKEKDLLVKILLDPQNYHEGTPLWIPDETLERISEKHQLQRIDLSKIQNFQKRIKSTAFLKKLAKLTHG